MSIPPLPTALKRQRAIKKWLFIAVVSIATLSFLKTGFLNLKPLTVLSDIASLFKEAFPPKLDVAPKLLEGAFETIVIAISASALSFIIALPLSFLAAKNTSLHPAIAYAMRSIFSAIRSIPELIMAILFVAAIGFGMLPGVIALSIISIGMLGRFFYESIERVKPGSIDAVRASADNRLQIIVYGILPQIFKEIFDYALYRFDCNLRASTYIGIVGAGGIGFQVMLSLRLMQYQELLTGIILIFIMIAFFEAMGKIMRRRVISEIS